MSDDTLLRIRMKTRATRSGECWEFVGALDHGYGRIAFNGRTSLVHRVAFELLVGPIPPGLDLDHLCRNRACWNPEHLQPVTRAENLRRGVNVAVAVRQVADLNRSKTHCAHGHPFSQSNTYIRPNGNRACVICQKRRSRESYLRRLNRRAGGVAA
jgi:hypothetical protein